MLQLVYPIFVALLAPAALSSPYAFLNLTRPTNSTYCDGSDLPANGGAFMCPKLNTTQPNSTRPILDYRCHDIYPADLAVVNARYPDYDQRHLHNARRFFMLRRQVEGEGEIGTRVQFTGLPSRSSNSSCRLEFVLPQPQFQHISGFNPTFNVYQVEREADSIATWNTYVGNDGVDLFGRVNGEALALDTLRAVGGVAAINETKCNETLTFQMGMTYNGRNGTPNYWDFSQVSPPAWPVQGFKIVYGC